MPSVAGTARSIGLIVGLTIAVLIGTGALLAITHSNSAVAPAAPGGRQLRDRSR